MQNLRKCKGSFKGAIGECMFHLEKPESVITHFNDKYKFLKMYKHKFSQEQKEFLFNNWYTIDAIELTNNKPILYEIKMKNWYKEEFRHEFKITENSYETYKKAEQINFDIKFAIVRLFDNWNFCVNIKYFEDHFFQIDKQKKYDKEL